MRLLIIVLALVSFMGNAIAQEGGMDPGASQQQLRSTT